MTYLYDALEGVMSRLKTKLHDQTLDPKCIGPDLAGKWVVPNLAILIRQVLMVRCVPGLFLNERLLNS